MGLQPVGHIGKAEHGLVPQPLQQAGAMGLYGFQQLQQVDDLVVAPVADVAPGVCLVFHFPVDAVAADAVGVVAIGCHGAQEHRHHRSRITRFAGQQGFPVLEDVAPVAFIADETPAVLAAHPDGEAVPRAAGVAVAPAEGQWQVTQDQPFQLRPALAGCLQGRVAVQTGGVLGQQRGQLLARHTVAAACVGQELVSVQVQAIDKHAAAHDVEEHIGLVVCGRHRRGGILKGVRPGQQLGQACRVALAGLGDVGGRACTLAQLGGQLEGLGL